MRASVRTLWSLRPLPVPPMATTASVCSSFSAASSVMSPVTAAPLSASMALAMSVAALFAIAPGLVHTTRTRGCRTITRSTPNAASKATSIRRSAAPDRRSFRPAAASASGASVPSPGATTASASAVAPRVCTVSSVATASAPSGKASPVSMRTGAPDERRRRIRTGVERLLRAHGKTVAQRQRRLRMAGRGLHVGGERETRGFGERFLARRDRHDRQVEACQHVAQRGQPRDPLDIGILKHVRNLT